jgi:hypothetical protein
MSDAALEAEARVFAHYLVGGTPEPAVVARYCAASRALWPAPPGARDSALLDFVRRRPWSVGPLDAAAALLDPGGLLRSKVLMMSALLEATPAHADDFLPRSVSARALLWRLASSGTVAVLQAAVGALLYRLVGRARA